MLLVGKDVKYGANGGVVNTALTPDMLDAGSIGMYTVGTDNKFKLIIKGSAGTGQISSTAVKTGQIVIYQGLGSGQNYPSEAIQVANIIRVLGTVYRAGTGEIVYIGYNGTSGTLQGAFLGTQPSSGTVVPTDPDLLYRQEASIKFKVRKAGNNEFGNLHYITVPVVPGDTPNSVAAKLVAQANQIQPYDSKQYFTATLVGGALDAPVLNALSTATTGGTVASSTAVFVKVVAKTSTGVGAASNEQTITTGAGTETNTVTSTWSVINGNSGYRVYIGTSSGTYTKYFDVSAGTNTYTYTGAAGTAGSPPVVTAGGGIKLVAIDTTETYSVSMFGVLENSPITVVGILPPAGDPAQLKLIEADSNAYRGDLYTLSALDKHLTSQVDTAATYDLYQIKAINTGRDKTGTEAQSSTEINVYVAFVVQADVLDTNQQANFEDILTDIYPSTPQISA